jgi:hypothetical protein
MFGKESFEAAARDHSESTPTKVLLQNFQHFQNLYEIMKTHIVPGKATYFMNGATYAFDRAILHKQEVAFRIGSVSNHALVFGSYCGHTLLILLASNPFLRITCVDNAPYSTDVVTYLNEHFQNRTTLLFSSSDSIKLFSDNIFDAVFMDADHTFQLCIQFNEVKRVALQGAFIIFDGYEQVKPIVDSWISDKILSQTMISRCLWTNIVTNLCKK